MTMTRNTFNLNKYLQAGLLSYILLYRGVHPSSAINCVDGQSYELLLAKGKLH